MKELKQSFLLSFFFGEFLMAHKQSHLAAFKWGEESRGEYDGADESKTFVCSS